VLLDAIRCFGLASEEIIQVKVKQAWIDKIREINADYKNIPAVYIVDNAVKHFLDELQKKGV